MPNLYPCTYCKSRHRRCVSSGDPTSCQLCTEMKVVCVPCELEDLGELPVRDGDHHLQLWQRQMNQLNTDLDAINEVVGQFSGWDLRIENGCIYVESRIRSLSELLEYNRASIRYLSPFQHFIDEQNIKFKEIPASIALASTGLVVRHAAPRSRPHHTIRYDIRDTAYSAINGLITLYLERYNAFVGVIHAETFINYYLSLDDPLTSPLVSAICVDAIAYFYPQLEYSEQEKRDLAEFFYVHCKDKILDMHDDPERRLEAVVSSSLLVQYLMDVLLEYTEARRLITIALLAAHEVESQELSLVQRAMFERSRTCLQTSMCTVDAILEDRFDYSRVSSVPMIILSDESQAILIYCLMWKHVIELAGSRYIVAVMERVGDSIIHGRPCEMSLDLILQFEPTIRAWWKNLPNELRLCDDPFDLKSVHQAIENAPSSTHMLPLAGLHVFTAIIQSTLLQPYSSVDGRGNNDIIDILRERVHTLTWCSTQTLIHIMKKNLEVDIEAMPLSLNYMMGILHAVCNVVSSVRIELPPEIQSMLVNCFAQLHSKVLSGHYIPESTTKLQSFITTRKSNPIDVYQRYPMPRVAMLSDIFHTCFKQLNSIIDTSSL
ncbi:hypothetical protein BJV82DRAFT_625503 [Fennellomyces sp. T-0311]|nr:hypothetical protein BJV82DRAFT_625503 [Fennellomyces sp. T-0311]